MEDIKSAIIENLEGLNEEELTYIHKMLMRHNQGTVKSIAYIQVDNTSENVLNIRKINIV